MSAKSSEILDFAPGGESKDFPNMWTRLDNPLDMSHTRYMNNARMIGKTGQPFCGSRCCGVGSKVKSHKRMLKRRERQAWKSNI